MGKSKTHKMRLQTILTRFNEYEAHHLNKCVSFAPALHIWGTKILDTVSTNRNIASYTALITGYNLSDII
jgi:hypothetical protein